MRLVIDTNAIVSALLWHGSPHRLLDEVRLGSVNLISSPILMVELADVLGRAKFALILKKTGRTFEQTMAEMQQMSEVIATTALDIPTCRDPDDDHVLACALAGEADLIVSGDKDLLVLQSFHGIPIINAVGALEILKAG